MLIDESVELLISSSRFYILQNIHLCNELMDCRIFVVNQLQDNVLMDCRIVGVDQLQDNELMDCGIVGVDQLQDNVLMVLQNNELRVYFRIMC